MASFMKKACWPYPRTRVDFNPKFFRTGRDRNQKTHEVRR